MNKYSWLFFGTALIVGISCIEGSTDKAVLENKGPTNPTNVTPTIVQDQAIHRNGKLVHAIAQESIYVQDDFSGFTAGVLTDEVRKGLEQQLIALKKLRKRSQPAIPGVETGIGKLERTIRTILDTEGVQLPSNLEAYKIKGQDGQGQVKITGYYTPVIRVRRERTAKYRYPIYAKPHNWDGPMPSRAEINAGVLDSAGTRVLAYAANAVDVYFMQVQGSGLVEYPDGKRELLAYGGHNRHPYRSIGRYMVKQGYIKMSHASVRGIRNYLSRNPELLIEVLNANPSYVFFNRSKAAPRGATMVPLLKDHSIAVDPRYIPLGSAVLAKVPVVNQNEVVAHEYRVLLAQDTGGAIKGPDESICIWGPDNWRGLKLGICTIMENCGYCWITARPSWQMAQSPLKIVWFNSLVHYSLISLLSRAKSFR